MTEDSQETLAEALPAPQEPRHGWRGLMLLALVMMVLLVLQPYLDRDALLQWGVAQEADLQAWAASYPVASWLAAFGVYVAVAGLALPIAVLVSLFLGWWLGFWPALLLVSFASTAGASIAFLLSRTLLGKFLQQRYASQLARMNRAFETEGAFYLFSLRLMPYVPFFLVNVLMGLTPIRLRTFWWVSQIGMLPGTMVYIYAGSSVPGLRDIAERGGSSLMSPRLLASFILVGTFPLVARKAWQRWRPASTEPSSS